MRVHPILLTAMILLLGQRLECQSCSHQALQGKIDPSDKRFKTFEYVLKEMENRDARIIVETGTARHGTKNCRGDGCSTCIWADWASQNNGYVYSVDISPKALANAKAAIGNLGVFVSFVQSDSVDFLRQFDGSIDFLYLDSFGFKKNDPLPSQMHHLLEIEAAYSKLTTNSIVMIDDCDLPHGGKGYLVVKYLQDRGWKIAQKGYQIVMVRDSEN